MKKVWYLENKNNDKTKTAKLFLYDKNGIVEAWLDLSSFAGGRKLSDWEIVFLSSDGKEIGRISYASGEAGDDFLQDAMSGKGRIGEDIAEKLREHQRTLELCVKVDGEIFASAKGMTAVFEAGNVLSKNGQAGDKNEISGNDGQSRDDLDRNVSENANAAWSNSELRNEPDLDEPDFEDVSQMEAAADNTDDGLRRVVELSVLEDEMLFRAYVHNSFLLHGYYNYGHLVLDEKNGKSRLGVPGNYYEREEIVAGMFGFPDFEPAKGREKRTGVFGYYFTKG